MWIQHQLKIKRLNSIRFFMLHCCNSNATNGPDLDWTKLARSSDSSWANNSPCVCVLALMGRLDQWGAWENYGNITKLLYLLQKNNSPSRFLVYLRSIALLFQPPTESTKKNKLAGAIFNFLFVCVSNKNYWSTENSRPENHIRNKFSVIGWFS